MRSKLFVPASRPELFEKALAGQADALSFDLEDAVTPERKPQARAELQAFFERRIATPAARSGNGEKRLIVRINARDTAYYADDIAAVVRSGLHYINLPKAETVDDVISTVRAIEAAERANGVISPVALLLNIETPAGLLNAAALAAAHPRVAGLQLGLGDLFEPFGISRREPSAIRQAMFAVRMAAAAAGIFAYDSAFANIQDEAGFIEEAKLARALGYLGKTCIHPKQIALANEAFRPSDEEIAHAVRVVLATRHAQANGIGAYVVDGKMIDPPFSTRAQALVDDAARMGLLDDTQRHELAG